MGWLYVSKGTEHREEAVKDCIPQQPRGACEQRMMGSVVHRRPDGRCPPHLRLCPPITPRFAVVCRRTLTPGLLLRAASYNAGINRGFIETSGFVIWASFLKTTPYENR
ncbi:hypothetical protein COCON_G00139010 [Conger conger]|uniref:Uncharacterized protein n=1 Tax=Conger conger TaxID=82655 RepID=A0A9Q1DAA7_CONCO|nr:hypothetical protein COCON_G00139010 [Conger conger]